MIDTCPCCGHKSDKIKLPSEMEHFSPSELKIVQLLEKRGEVATETLTDIMYGDRFDGGPDYGQAVILVMVSRVRAKLKKHGFGVTPIYGFGYRLIRL